MRRYTSITYAILCFACQSAFGYTLDYTANSLNQYTAISASGSPVYDADGNMTGDGTFSYAYDAENRLVSVTSAMETNGAVRVAFETLAGRGHRPPSAQIEAM